MIIGIKQNAFFKWSYRVYVWLFFIYLALPLTVVCVFAFNDSQFPSMPWEGFTWNWFFGSSSPQIGVFHERSILRSIGISGFIAFWVALLFWSTECHSQYPDLSVAFQNAHPKHCVYNIECRLPA